MMDLSTTIYFGNTIYDIILCILMIFFGIIVGKIFNSIIKRQLKKIVGKTKTKFDDMRFDAIELPASILI